MSESESESGSGTEPEGVSDPSSVERGPELVLASGSRYRAGLLEAAGIPVTIDPPDLDERSLDHLFIEIGAEAFALELAERKGRSVAGRHPGSLVLAADQVGVLELDGEVRQLTKAANARDAVRQLMSMSGTTHGLVNGLIVLATSSGQMVKGVDMQRVTMRRFDEAEARAYVEKYSPFDSSGSYRLEDQDSMSPDERFVVAVAGEDDSGVLGLPMPLLYRMLNQVGWRRPPPPRSK